MERENKYCIVKKRNFGTTKETQNPPSCRENLQINNIHISIIFVNK